MLDGMIQFLENFNTEKQCFQYLENLRWWDGFHCPKCGEKKFWRAVRGYRICSWCKNNLRVTAWTVFHWERVDLRVVFLIVWFMVISKRWISAEELSNILQVNVRTTWIWQHKIRGAMILPKRKKLTWSVEVDEIFIWGTQPWKRWRWAIWKQKVIIAVEVNKSIPNKKGLIRGMWRVRISVIPNCGHLRLKRFILENIETWTTLYTDNWKGYSGIEEVGFTRIIEQEKAISDEIKWVNVTEITPNVHIIASLVKRWLLWTHQKYLAKHGYLQSYLDEYTFRYNRRNSKNRGKLFEIIMKQIISTSPTTYALIKQKFA